MSENDLTVTAEFVSDEGLAVTWSERGHRGGPIAILLDNGSQKLRRALVEKQLMTQFSPALVIRLLALVNAQFPDAFDPASPD